MGAALTSLERYRGAILGLAAGDALGTTLEFTKPGEFEPMTDMVGGGPFHLKPGEWTDDTSMALCLAESLLECGAFDPVDQLVRYVRWNPSMDNLAAIFKALRKKLKVGMTVQTVRVA